MAVAGAGAGAEIKDKEGAGAGINNFGSATLLNTVAILSHFTVWFSMYVVSTIPYSHSVTSKTKINCQQFSFGILETSHLNN